MTLVANTVAMRRFSTVRREFKPEQTAKYWTISVLFLHILTIIISHIQVTPLNHIQHQHSYSDTFHHKSPSNHKITFPHSQDAATLRSIDSERPSEYSARRFRRGFFRRFRFRFRLFFRVRVWFACRTRVVRFGVDVVTERIVAFQIRNRTLGGYDGELRLTTLASLQFQLRRGIDQLLDRLRSSSFLFEVCPNVRRYFASKSTTADAAPMQNQHGRVSLLITCLSNGKQCKVLYGAFIVHCVHSYFSMLAPNICRPPCD